VGESTREVVTKGAAGDAFKRGDRPLGDAYLNGEALDDARRAGETKYCVKS